jgi:tRNA pseudouridine13 synthase
MKLKCQPEDFRVEELPLVSPSGQGRYAFYRLTKSGLGTLEAVNLVCRRWNIAGRRISYGGLKDRHARTIQYLTVFDGPSASINNPAYSLEHLGRLEHPYGAADFRGNRFELVIRDLSGLEAKRALDLARSLEAGGLPNYFDDQRFGSVGASGEFIGHAWLKGNAERALELALAEANPSDRRAAKTEKSILREYWGRWPEAKSRLDRSSARSIVTYLVDHPADFRGAFARMRRELRTLYFSAFQSHLWNLILARSVEHLTRPDQRIVTLLKAGPLPFPCRLDPEQTNAFRGLTIPLPSSRNALPDEGPRRQVIEEVLAGFQLTWSDLRVRHLKDVFFSKGSRPALAFPEKLAGCVSDDEMHRGRKALELSFELGKGSYATIMVKRITEPASPS